MPLCSQIFPFFTYIPSGGLFDDSLPRVLFFSRIGADTIGRFVPRSKAFVTKSPSLLLALAIAKVDGLGHLGMKITFHTYAMLVLRCDMPRSPWLLS